MLASSITSFLVTELNSPIMNTVTQASMNRIQIVASGLATAFYLINLAWNYAKNSIKATANDDWKFFDIEDIVRTLIILAIIGNYSIIANGISSFTNIIVKATDKDNGAYIRFQDNALKYQEKQAEINANIAAAQINENKQSGNPSDEANTLAEDQEAVSTEEGSDFQAGFSWNPLVWIQLLTAMLFEVLQSIIGVIIVLITMYTYRVLLVVGSLAFAFSILPVFRKSLETWFNAITTMSMVFVTINILDGMNSAFFSAMAHQDVLDITAAYDLRIGNIVITILYLMSFWLTSRYVGRADAGGVVGKTISMATMTIAGASSMMAANNAAKGAASSGGGANNVAGAAAKAGKFEDDGK